MPRCNNTVLVLEPKWLHTSDGERTPAGVREVEKRCGSYDWAGRLILCPLCGGDESWTDRETAPKDTH